jgi:hypothetical protein
VILVQNRIIENDAAMRRGDNVTLNMLPNQMRGHFVSAKGAIHRIMTQAFGMFDVMGHRKVDVA